MTYFCPRGFHWFLPVLPRVYYNKKHFKWSVTFDNSCRYRIGVDQYDSNKIVGISNYLNPRKQSIRFAWSYSPERDVFKVGLFTENNKKFIRENLTSVEVDQKVELEMIIINPNELLVRVDNYFEKIVSFPTQKFIFRTNPYFGGNRKCPHHMSIDLKTLI